MDINIEGINEKFWLIIFFVGAIFWTVRQVLPQKIEENRIWKVILRAGPFLLGGAIACIPAIRPVENNIIESCFLGAIGGSLAQTIYGTLRQVVPEKIKSWLGSKAKRKMEG